MAAIDAAALGAALHKACRLDVVAFKPGNVSLCADGHGMVAADFLASARVAIPALCRAGSGVGARIEAAVAATWAAVACNTNLGIVLLLAPLAAAAERGGPLRAAVQSVLADLDVTDAELAYAAIRRANPAGLGRAADADVAAPPTIDLRTAMGLAAARDSIARQYANGYADVFEVGLATLGAARRRWRSLAWATTACHLEFMARWPDSHIVRKHGERCAERVRTRAVEVATALKACENPRSLAGTLQAFDSELKTRGVNPGTSADLTVASAAVLLLQDRFSE
ncbi:MAG: triphosphoribosyl-dephospho-CoA synthase [Gammaproteobacteria bacterium]|nr:triphosphoribosyl-dephospho-CoA synthase [Gammaproteobacteria bacterium]MCP5202440.1 triphosphoribosyl-dephospho-CoA synthase [Gammaproteobacteria bacterium]